MPTLRVLPMMLVLAACGASAGEEPSTPEPARDAPPSSEPAREPKPAADTPPAATPGNVGKDAEAAARRPAGEDGLRVAPARARLTVQKSTYGPILFDANGQVVYAFQRDERNRSRCTSEECVTAWPPVLTNQPPSAGAGVTASRLGTTRRADGTLQVTYAGRPLYFYEHEAPGEVKCHNVDIHGGLWWVVAPNGKPVGT